MSTANHGGVTAVSPEMGVCEGLALSSSISFYVPRVYFIGDLHLGNGFGLQAIHVGVKKTTECFLYFLICVLDLGIYNKHKCK